MQMPAEILCEKCGQKSRVLTDSLDDDELAGQMAGDDLRLTDGFAIQIECPHCGARQQFVAPPP